MKIITYFVFLIIIFSFLGCDKDSILIVPGTDGSNGSNGSTGQNGLDGTNETAGRKSVV